MGERAGDGSFKGPWGDKLKTDSFRSHSCGIQGHTLGVPGCGRPRQKDRMSLPAKEIERKNANTLIVTLVRVNVAWQAEQE